MNKYLSKNSVLRCFIIIVIFIGLSGCYSYRSISMEDYKQDKEHNSIKFLLKSGEEIIISEKDSVQISADDDKVLLSRRGDERTINFNEIEKIKEERFDYFKMCLGTSWITFGLILAIMVLFHPKMSVG